VKLLTFGSTDNPMYANNVMHVWKSGRPSWNFDSERGTVSVIERLDQACWESVEERRLVHTVEGARSEFTYATENSLVYSS